MGKRKKLEEIIPKETLDSILNTYKKIKEIEDTSLKEFEKLVKSLVKIDNELQKITNEGWLPESFTNDIFEIIENAALHHNKKGLHADLHLFLKSELETTISSFSIETGKKTVKRKSKGQPRQYAKSFLIAMLAGEIKSRTGNPNYDILEEFLKQYYHGLDTRRLALEVKRIRESQSLLHFVEIFSNHNF